jgi:uncharacterized protein HemY
VVLARVIRLSVEQQDWEAVIAAIPAARRRGAFDAGRLEHIERRAWLGLLGAAAADADALERLWRRVPAAIRADAEAARRYADRLATLSPAR